MLKPDFEKRNGLIVVVVQDFKTKQVLMQAYMNKLAWEKTLETRMLYLWSTSRELFWFKGEESGNRMVVKEMYLDCDRDCALILVEVQGKGVACHTGSKTCFSKRVE